MEEKNQLVGGGGAVIEVIVTAILVAKLFQNTVKHGQLKIMQ